MGGKWLNRGCSFCNGQILGRGIKVGKCPNDGVVFWVHPEHLEAYREKYRRLGIEVN